LPGLAFTAEPAEKNIMNRPPRSPDESIFSRGMWQHILWVGLLIGLLSLAAQGWAYERAPAHWQTMVFTVLVFAQLFQALAVRSRLQSLASVGLFSNPQLLAAIAITVVLQLVVIYVPVFNTIFHTEPLPLSYLAICFGLGACVLLAVELEKLCRRSGWFGSTSTAHSA
jgi:Ca2+-transporting ATPase